MLRPFLAPLWAVLSSETTALPILRFVGGVERPESWFIRRGSLKGEENLYYLRRIFVAFPPPRGLRVGYRRQSMGHGKCPIGGSPRWYASKLQPKLVNKFKAATGDPAFNTLWEALALLIACRIWLPKCKVQHLGVRVKSDNVGALRMLLTLSSKAADINVVAMELALTSLDSRQLLEHIPGVTNVMPALSRLWAPSASDSQLWATRYKTVFRTWDLRSGECPSKIVPQQIEFSGVVV